MQGQLTGTVDVDCATQVVNQLRLPAGQPCAGIEVFLPLRYGSSAKAPSPAGPN
ncbi:MAG TPA: hypothetical protein VN253_03150 [Kofleriaceae bacterium]|nr:hypothetical protein [Kofleriaceae bacterium]